LSRIRCSAACIAACATIAAAGASAAAAKPTTLHFFSKQVYFRLSDATGKPLSQNTPLAVGDRVSIAANDYAGNHKHHAKRPSASDHIVCTLTSVSAMGGPGSALCDGMSAIGGSLILGDDWVLNFTSNAPTTIAITGGTGRYQNAHGTVTVVSINSSGTKSDLTIKLR
jgi:hypothetical protein